MKLKRFWSDYLVALFLIAAFLFFIIVGEDSYIAVHDNLDLFIPQFQMMKTEGTFFAHGAGSGFLHGISRDVFASEFSLGTVFYMIMPCFYAYVCNYIAKILIGYISGRLLAKELLGDATEKYHHLINLCAFAYGCINFFPCFGIAFASIPLVVFLLLKIERTRQGETKQLVLWYLALWAYPFISYFSYIGFFILAYMVIALVWISIAKKKFDLRMLIALFVLGIGYVCFEYRLFAMMLLSDEVNIRSTMVLSDFTFGQAMHEMWDVFVNNSFHADALTKGLVMPVCMLYFVVSNIYFVVKRKWNEIFKSPFNLIILILIFDSFIYGMYTFKPMRDLVETLVPPLSGFQFDRTSFFNPFLWVCALFCVCKRIMDIDRLPTVKYIVSLVLCFTYILTILYTPTRYNDLRTTAVNMLKSRVFDNSIDDFSYREFYNTSVFEKAKADIGYDGEWSVAYGLYPAQLEYSAINTLDGYLGFYSQEYKEEFRKIIAPALDRREASRIYFDDWGARAYLYSGDEDSVVRAYKSFVPESNDLYIDVDAFKALDGTYIFSRFELSGDAVDKLTLRGVYGELTDAYMLYVYEVK